MDEWEPESVSRWSEEVSSRRMGGMSEAIQSRLREERKLELMEAISRRALVLLPIPLLLGVLLPFRPGVAFWGLWMVGQLALLVLASLQLRPVPRRIDEVDEEIGAQDGLVTWVLAMRGLASKPATGRVSTGSVSKSKVSKGRAAKDRVSDGRASTVDAPSLESPAYQLLRLELETRLVEDEVEAHHKPRLRQLSKRLLILLALIVLLVLLGPLIWGGFRAAKAFSIATGITAVPVRVSNPNAQEGKVAQGKTSDQAPQSEGAEQQDPQVEDAEVDPTVTPGETMGPQLPSPRRHIPPQTRLRPNPDQPRSQPPEYEPRTDWTRQVERALGRGVLEDWEGQWLGSWGRYLDRRKVEMGGQHR